MGVWIVIYFAVYNLRLSPDQDELFDGGQVQEARRCQCASGREDAAGVHITLVASLAMVC